MLLAIFPTCSRVYIALFSIFINILTSSHNLSPQSLRTHLLNLIFNIRPAMSIRKRPIALTKTMTSQASILFAGKITNHNSKIGIINIKKPIKSIIYAVFVFCCIVSSLNRNFKTNSYL